MKFCPSCLLPLNDITSIAKILLFNMCCCLYVSPCTPTKDRMLTPIWYVRSSYYYYNFTTILMVSSYLFLFYYDSAPIAVNASNFSYVGFLCGNSIVSHATEILNDFPIIELFMFSHKYAKLEVVLLDSTYLEIVIIVNGQTFWNIVEFHDVVYLMLLVGRFCYLFKRKKGKTHYCNLHN